MYAIIAVLFHFNIFSHDFNYCGVFIAVLTLYEVIVNGGDSISIDVFERLMKLKKAFPKMISTEVLLFMVSCNIWTVSVANYSRRHQLLVKQTILMRIAEVCQGSNDT